MIKMPQQPSSLPLAARPTLLASLTEPKRKDAYLEMVSLHQELEELERRGIDDQKAWATYVQRMGPEHHDRPVGPSRQRLRLAQGAGEQSIMTITEMKNSCLDNVP